MRQKPTRCLLKSLSAGLGDGESMIFEKGNQAAARPNKKAVAEMILQKLEKDRDSLSDAQFTTLVTKFNTLTAKRRRRSRKEPESETVIENWADRLTPEEADIHRAVLEIEAEQARNGKANVRYADGTAG
jgi:hypothetical protein